MSTRGNQFRCECRHNTCGESCNECCPLFNQLPWKPGTHAQPNICQPCQCFNHADRCEYDADIEAKRLSMTPDGIYEGGGRCIECRDNTEGINCEKCKYGFYRPSNVSHYLANACRACDCDPIGSEHMECVRDETSTSNDLKPGDCICKPGFGGRHCDKCAPGHRNHPACKVEAMTQDACPIIQNTTESPSVSGVRYGVSTSSHSRINFRNDTPYPNPENFKLTFSFRTVKKDGMLWVWANYKYYTRYFYLIMESGFLSLEVKGHKQPKVQRYNAKRLDDNEWHHVDLRKQGHEVRLQVDDLPPQLMKDMPNPKVMKRRMYVGGVISRHKKNFTLPLDGLGFVGCIRNFEVDGQVCDLVKASRDVVPCAVTQGVAYVHSGGFASFDTLRDFGPKPNVTDFSIRFRSSQPNGLILSLLSNTNHMEARLTTHIENRSLVLNALLVKYEVDISQRIDLTICDNQWHEFSVDLGTTHFILRLDDIRREIPVQISNEAIEMFRSLPVHVGGLS
uniref:Uncharacterized protein n=1 Tax=Acrobeloides nanus TaxID=290746 RepID=A0A914CS68_9BILA